VFEWNAVSMTAPCVLMADLPTPRRAFRSDQARKEESALGPAVQGALSIL
jgi:hypothetical protein